jgi:hypothetical protein
MPDVLIVGVSTRAAAESAARAGFRVTAIDGYADLDQHPSVRALSMRRDVGRSATARGIARAAAPIECDGVVYLSPFENHPRAVATLGLGRALWGNSPEVLRRVRNPLLLAATLRKHGLAAPNVRLNDPNDPNDWIAKPLRSGGGQRVSRWAGGQVRRGYYLQERIDGTPASVVLVAAPGRAVPLGVSRQLVGDPAFGARPYRYCGNIIAHLEDRQFDGGAALVEEACALARVVAAEFGLTGVNGIDFLARGAVPHAIEVNPRWSGAVEVLERRLAAPLFAAHADACTSGTLSSVEPLQAMRSGGAAGKAIVFARTDVEAGDTRPWLSDPDVRDVPHPGERIAAGQPICTVFATGVSAQDCYTALAARAGRIYNLMTIFPM